MKLADKSETGVPSVKKAFPLFLEKDRLTVIVGLR